MQQVLILEFILVQDVRYPRFSAVQTHLFCIQFAIDKLSYAAIINFRPDIWLRKSIILSAWDKKLQDRNMQNQNIVQDQGHSQGLSRAQSTDTGAGQTKDRLEILWLPALLGQLVPLFARDRGSGFVFPWPERMLVIEEGSFLAVAVEAGSGSFPSDGALLIRLSAVSWIRVCRIGVCVLNLWVINIYMVEFKNTTH